MAEADICPRVRGPGRRYYRFIPCRVFMAMEEMRRDGQRMLTDLLAASTVILMLQTTLFFLPIKFFLKPRSVARTSEPPGLFWGFALKRA
jgi:hypothetical protein